MKFTKNMQTIAGMATVLLFLFMTFPSLATEMTVLKMKYGQSQEHMGESIKEAAWLRWNRGKIQAETARFIQEGGLTGNISQEALGSGIAATAHLDWELMKKQEQLGAAIVRIAQVVNQETAITRFGQMQEMLGTFIASSAVINQEAGIAKKGEVRAAQVSMGQEIQKQGQINWIMGTMAKAAYAKLEGDETQKISGAMVALLRNNKAFEQERNFRLAMTLLEKETGQPMTQLLPNTSGTGANASSAQFTRGGLGGFAEFGFFAIAGFLYVGWVFSYFVTHLGYPTEMEEVPWEYPEAA